MYRYFVLILWELLRIGFASLASDVVEEAKINFQRASGFKWPEITSSFSLPGETDFVLFIAQYNKQYDSIAERAKRYRNFQVNSWIAQAIQSLDLGTATYGVTKFSDLSVEEFAESFRTLRPPSSPSELRVHSSVDLSQPAPVSVDWRQKGAVTPVKNQENCGSCWAFSTTGNIEGQWFLKTGRLISLSEQELVDCDHNDAGCNGGLQTQAFETIIEQLGGLESEQLYPYTGHDDRCVMNKTDFAAHIDSYLTLPSNETEMAIWCAANGPIAIAINAYSMQTYKGGISHPGVWCNKDMLDHGVLIVGYGVENSVPFWIIKNSWGLDYGEEGYYRAYRGANVCGLAEIPSSAVIY